MKTRPNPIEIPLQVGSELRITKDGAIAVSNPELELVRSREAVDAVLSYRFDEASKDHVLRLLEPVAKNKLRKVHTHKGQHAV